MENGYSEKNLIEHRLKEYKPLIAAAFEYPWEGYILFSINTKEIYEVTVDLPISSNILFNFQNRQVL